MFKLDNENNKIFDKIIVRIGGFHIIICLLRTIYSCFRNTGLLELLSRVGLGGKVTIQNALKSGDAKYDIYLHKLSFEAIARRKTHHAVKTDEVFSEKIYKVRILMQNVIEKITKKVLMSQFKAKNLQNQHNLKEIQKTFLKTILIS